MPLVPDKENRGQLILTKAHQIPVGLDVDCLHGNIYWSDVSNRNIYRAPYNGSWTETILEEETESPEGIAIDWISRNIYWTDSSKDTIEVATLDGAKHKVLIKEGLIDPRGIVVHPGFGKMYWTDWNRDSPKIESSFMDGTNRKVLLQRDLGLPNMLTIDFKHNDLCWTDAGLKTIECIGLAGNNRRVIYAPAAYPFDLTVADDHIYWTDWEIKFVQRVSRHGGEAQPLELPLGGNGKVYGIVTIPEQCPQMSNPCAVKNGGCRHICLPNGRGGRTCACPDSTAGQEDCNEVGLP
jgi:nidogen (entactin)